MSSLRPIYTYHPHGDYEGAVHDICHQGTVNALINAGVEKQRIVEIPDTSYLTRTLEDREKAVLVIPGGRTLMLSASFGSKDSAQRITQAVCKKGWNYLGFCSGGAVACSRLEHRVYEDLFKSAVTLNLLPNVTAEYPVFNITYGQDNGRVTPIKIKGSDEPLNCYWNEGHSYYVPADLSHFCYLEKLAVYTDPTLPRDRCAAMLLVRGEGTVVSLGVHPELTAEGQPTPLKTDPSYQPTDPDTLAKETLLNQMFQRLRIID